MCEEQPTWLITRTKVVTTERLPHLTALTKNEALARVNELAALDESSGATVIYTVWRGDQVAFSGVRMPDLIDRYEDW